MRAQYAVSVIVLALLGMFLMYLILSTPYERYCMITGSCGNDTDGGADGGTGTSGSIYSTTVGWIGGTDGERIGTTHSFTDIGTHYLLTRNQLDFLPELALGSNIIISGTREFLLNNVDANDTDGAELSFALDSEAGNPLVEVYLNGVLVSQRNMQAGENLTVSMADLLENNSIILRCAFQGWAFWETQACNFENVKLVKREYENPVVSTQTLLLSQQEQAAPVARIRFWVEEMEGSGELELRLNGALLYRGLPEVGNNTVESNDVTLSGSNTLEFTATKGSSYTVTKADVELFSEIEPKTIKVITLPDSVASQIISSADGARLILTVTEVQVDGLVYFTLFPAHITHPADVMEGSVFTDVESDEMDPIANTIRIESPDAKFYASEFRIVLR